jgi:hypothetical protein
VYAQFQSGKRGDEESLCLVLFKRGAMDAKMITFGETSLDKLLQWLRSSGEPKDIKDVLQQYLLIISKSVTEDSE